MIQISKITFLSLLAQHPYLQDSAQLSIQCLVDGKVVSKSEAMEGRKSVWRYRDTLNIVDDPSTFQLSIVQENYEEQGKQLSVLDLSYADIISKKDKKYFDWTIMEKTMLLRLKINITSEDTDTLAPDLEIEHISEDIDALLDDLKIESLRQAALNTKFVNSIHKRISALENTEEKIRQFRELCTILSNHWSAHGHSSDVILAVTCYIDLFKLDSDNVELAEKLGLLGYECFQACGTRCNTAVNSSKTTRRRASGLNLMNETEDGDAAIAAFKQATEIVPDSDRRKYDVLLNLANSYSSKFDSLTHLEDLNEAIEASQRFHTANIQDNEEALQLFERASAKTDDDYLLPLVLHNLGRAYLIRHEHSGKQEDIEKGVVAIQKTLDSSSEYHPVRPYVLINLARAYQHRYETTGSSDDLDKSININEDVLKTIPYGHPNQPGTMSNLSNLFLRKFEATGNFLDIDKAVGLLKDAIEVTVDFDFNKLRYLNNLAIALSRRFQRFGSVEDHTSAIEAVEKVLELNPEKHADRAMYLNNLANILFEDGSDKNRDKALAALEEAVNITSDVDKGKPRYLHNLGNALIIQFRKTGVEENVHRASDLQQKAVNLLQHNHQSRPSYLLSLGDSLVHLFKASGDREDIDKGISLMQVGIAHIADDDFEKGIFHISIGMAFLERYKTFGNKEDLELGISNFRNGYSSKSSPKVKLNAVMKWENTAQRYGHSSLMDAYLSVFELLPELAWLGLPIQDQYSGLTAISDIVRRAVTIAIQDKKYTTALEWSEQGHSVVWSQFLKLKTFDVESLTSEHPELAQEFLNVTSRLQMMSIHRDLYKMENSFQEFSPEETSQKQRSTTLEWENIVQKIRNIPGFERFLMPRKEFSGAARLGYVVVVNISSIGCDALALKPGDSNDIVHIPLDAFTEAQAHAMFSTFNEIILQGKRSVRSGRPVIQQGIQDLEKLFQRTLAALWMRIVKPILDGLGMKPLKATESLPRMWWCLSGSLAFLPIHAAGLYNPEQFGTKLSDYVISSYMPTLSTLIQRIEREDTHDSKGNFKLLVVGQHTTKGQSSLPGVIKEIETVRKHAVKHQVVVLEQSECTVQNVSNEMQQASWAHFACHGVQDTSNPTESGLILSSGDRLTLQEMMKLDLPCAGLAFLSACQTATGAKDLPEEAVHLAAGMLFAGYKGVVATMWAIGDEEAPKVADSVYGRLFVEQEVDYRGAAGALHCAVQELRGIHRSKYLDWVPFIHVGL
ncbi:CHAT domain-containing protein [Cyathus striatus]|nr:CHAT domain-containing protein [Cyathus striatus]